MNNLEQSIVELERDNEELLNQSIEMDEEIENLESILNSLSLGILYSSFFILPFSFLHRILWKNSTESKKKQQSPL
jgi:hypothetical protein